MPLIDHFQDQTDPFEQWTSFHSAWCIYMMERLNTQVLPTGYRAVPNIHLGIQAQVDVGTVHHGEEDRLAQEGNGAVATATWAPPRPPVVVSTDLADLDVVEIEVRYAKSRRLVAAVELVSPANKDRPSHRHAFVSKCIAYLQHDVSVVVVDVVTNRQENLHADLVDLLELGEEAKAAAASDLYAVAYRAVKPDGPPRLEMWPQALRVGEPLPTLPLWIGPELAVPLDLEASYVKACESLRLK